MFRIAIAAQRLQALVHHAFAALLGSFGAQQERRSQHRKRIRFICWCWRVVSAQPALSAAGAGLAKRFRVSPELIL
jgi:hypothetical protein